MYWPSPAQPTDVGSDSGPGALWLGHSQKPYSFVDATLWLLVALKERKTLAGKFLQLLRRCCWPPGSLPDQLWTDVLEALCRPRLDQRNYIWGLTRGTSGTDSIRTHKRPCTRVQPRYLYFYCVFQLHCSQVISSDGNSNVKSDVCVCVCVPQRCVGPLVTSPQRLSNAPWMQDTKDTGPRWTCECAQSRLTQGGRGEGDQKQNVPGPPLQMELGGHHVHAARRLSSLLAQEADADAAHDPGRNVRLLVSGVGGPIGHRQGFGRSPPRKRGRPCSGS